MEWKSRCRETCFIKIYACFGGADVKEIVDMKRWLIIWCLLFGFSAAVFFSNSRNGGFAEEPGADFERVE